MAEAFDRESPRKIAQATIARIRNYADLYAPTEKEGDARFNEKTRELWKEFAVHGVFGKDAKTGENIILNFTDLDGKIALKLLGLAGIDAKDVKYVAFGKYLPGKINLDTGNRHGIFIEDGGNTVLFDHHGKDSDNNTSASKLVYEGLISVGLLKREGHLDELVNFVTHVDNNTFPGKSELFKDSYRTLLGLQRFLQPDKLVAFFKVKRKPDELLGDGDLKWLDLVRRSEEQKKLVEESPKILEELENDGFVIDTPKYGKIVVDVDKKVRAGFDAVQGNGYQGYVIWNSKEKSFFVSTQNQMDFEPKQGEIIRKTMWIKPRHDEAPLEVSLRDILEQLSGGEINPQGKLKEYLEANS